MGPTPSLPMIFVLDDDAGMRRSTGMLLASAGLPFKAYERALDFLRDYSHDQPGCLLLDMSMPEMSGMELVERLRQMGAHLPVVIVSGTGSIGMAVRGMKLGVVEFLEKPVDPETLLAKVRAALDIDAAERAKADARRELADRLALLTERELEVTRCLIRGLSNKQVGLELRIAAKTVDKHRTRAMQKLKALNAADLVRISMSAGLK